MAIIDPTYFHDELEIPSVDGGFGRASKMTSDNSDELLRYIPRYEQKYLKEVLGESLYGEYIADQEAEKWTAMVDELRDTTLLLSPIANYVFYFLWERVCKSRSRSGDSVALIEKATMLSFRDGQIQAWNGMVEMNKVFFLWLSENRATYEHDDVTFNYDGIHNLLLTDNIFGL